MDEVTDKTDFLAELPIFANLPEEYLDDLAAIAREYEFDEGAVVAYQRDVVEDMYIVRSGRLYAQQVDGRGIVRWSRQYMAGDYFEDLWLFVPQTHKATVTAAQNGRLFLINNHDFIAFVTQHPNALVSLVPEMDDEGNLFGGLSEEAWAEALKLEGRKTHRSAGVNLLPDELVEYQARRSYWYLLGRLLLPALLMVGVPLLFYLLLRNFVGANFLTPFLLVIAGGFFLWLLFRFLDWVNDYFVITNKHLIHHEFDLRTFRIGIVKIPIRQVQSVEVLKPTLLANLFNVGSARVTTAAQKGVILFDYIDSPRQVKETLNRLSGRVQVMNAGETQLAMRRSVEGHFQLPPAYRPLGENSPQSSPKTAEEDSIASRIRRWAAWRVEENGVITYRKHLFVLLKQTLLPTLLFIACVGLLIFLMVALSLNTIWLGLLMGIPILGSFIWLVWRFEDWRNDIFQVSDRFVLDIDRTPFGFGESRKQAPIANVQNVNAERPNLWATLFNYGYVSVETAGAATDIVFESVPRPSAIQADIFQKLEAFQQQQRLRQGAERREEYAVLLDVYRQATEQSRIPQRTPPPGEFVESPDPGG